MPTNNNLFDGTLINFAFQSSALVSGTAYRSTVIPVRAGFSYHITRTIGDPANNRFRIAFLKVETPAAGAPIFGEINADSLTEKDVACESEDYKLMAIYLSNGASGSDIDLDVMNLAVIESRILANVTINETDYNGVGHVSLPITDGGGAEQNFVLPPSGTKRITENGRIDVSDYEYVYVDVQQ